MLQVPVLAKVVAKWPKSAVSLAEEWELVEAEWEEFLEAFRVNNLCQAGTCELDTTSCLHCRQRESSSLMTWLCGARWWC